MRRIHTILSLPGVLAGCALALALASPAKAADVIVFDNTTNFQGFAFANGGATNQAGNTITTMVADDINVLPSAAGAVIDGFSFSVANFNTTAVSARALVRFYAGDPSTGAPTTFLAGFNFAPISFTASTVTLFTYAPPVAGTPLFTVPSDGFFWAGITFDNNGGATGATAAQLNNLGQGLFDPPTVGASDDVFFQTTAAGSFAANNPAGGFFFFGGDPVASFGWRFLSPSQTAVPEPSTFALSLCVGLVATAAGVVRSRRKVAA